jgi:hypothetical protein
VGSGESGCMATASSDADQLERELLRRSVGALSEDRHRCHDCRRTPLIGERVYRFDGGRAVCELCRVLRADAPEGWEVVRHSDGHAVRLTVRAA